MLCSQQPAARCLLPFPQGECPRACLLACAAPFMPQCDANGMEPALSVPRDRSSSPCAG
jgi:hypothetical protein